MFSPLQLPAALLAKQQNLMTAMCGLGAPTLKVFCACTCFAICSSRSFCLTLQACSQRSPTVALQDAILCINNAGWEISPGNTYTAATFSSADLKFRQCSRNSCLKHSVLHAFHISATCSLQEEWSLTADENWISGFIDRSQPRLAVQMPWTASQTSAANQAPRYTKPINLARRSLQQAAQTLQATVAFTLFFPSQSPSSQIAVAQDTSDALKQATVPLNTITTIVPVASPNALALNVSILFPPGNTVSATPSQATLAAVTLTSALTTNPAQALPSLYARAGPFHVQGTSISNALVPQGSPSSTQRAPPSTASTLPNAPAVPSLSSSASPSTSPAVQTPLASSPPSPLQTPPSPVPPPPPSPNSLAALPSQVSMCMHVLNVLLPIDGNTVSKFCFAS